LDAVGDGNLDQHVLARAHHLLALAEVHLGRRGQDHRVGALDALAEVAGVMRDRVFLRDLGGGVLVAADERGDLDLGDTLERVEMLLAEGALAGYADFHRVPLLAMRWVGLRGAARRLLPAALLLLVVLLLPAGLLLPAALRRFSRMMWPTAVFDAGTV